MMTENYHLNQLQRLSDGASDHFFDVQPAAIFTEKSCKNVQYLNMKHSCKRNRYFPQQLVEKHNSLKKMNTRLPFIQRTTNRQVITDNIKYKICVQNVFLVPSSGPKSRSCRFKGLYFMLCNCKYYYYVIAQFLNIPTVYSLSLWFIQVWLLRLFCYTLSSSRGTSWGPGTTGWKSLFKTIKQQELTFFMANSNNY